MRVLLLLFASLASVFADSAVVADKATGTQYLDAPVGPPPPTVPVEHRLVDLSTLNPAPLLEIRYATKYNFTGSPLYPVAKAWLKDHAALALQKVQQELEKEGLGLKVYDGYRPPSVQRKMWDLIRDERYVSNPDASRGRHTRGTAVDVTLIDKAGNELPMPSNYDEFSERAHRDFKGGTEEQRKNRARLEEIMTRHGFDPFPFEWWHFDLKGWEQQTPFQITFEEILAGKTLAEPL